jgi:hypothetical protein
VAKVTWFYASTFLYGGVRQICSKHKTFYSAERAAKRCENMGGAYHDEIWEVFVYQRKEVKRGRP